ncbi:MAG: sugar phosphate isomerase/epimerase family protein, partial [Candidatus Sumerlaeota bacterium]
RKARNMIPALHSWSFRNKFKENPDFTIEQAIDQTAAFGFEGIEIMSGKAGGELGDFKSHDIAYLRDVKKYAEDAGVELICFSTYNDFAFVTNEEWRLQNIQFIKDWLRIAGELEVPNIRMLTGYYIEGEGRGKLEDLTRAGIEECIPVAEEAGVNMAIENHNSIFFQAEDIVKLIEDFGSDRLTACPDPSNGVKGFLTNEGGEEARERVFETARLLAPYATESHIKFKGWDEDGKPLGWGDGLERLFTIYRDNGYDGPVAVESVCDGDLIAPMEKLQTLMREAMEKTAS